MADREDSPTHGQPESPDEVSFGNRPAAGARVADHASSFGAGHGVGAEATDFLGLSSDLGGIDVVASPAGEHGAGSFPAEHEAQAETSASWLLDPAAGAPTDTEDEDGSHETEATQRRAGGRGFATWYKTAAAMLLGAGATFGFLTWSRSQPADTASPDTTDPTTAQAPRPKPAQPSQLPQPPQPIGIGDPSGPEGLAESTDGGTGGRQSIQPDGQWSEPEPRPIAATDPGTGPTPSTTTDTTGSGVETGGGRVEVDPTPTPRPGEQRLAQWVDQHGGSAGEESGTGGTLTNLLGLGANQSRSGMPAVGPYSSTLPDSEFVADPANGTGTPGNESGPSALRRGARAEATPANAPISGLRLATPEELASIWPGDTIPMEAMDADARLLTPAVGDVRTVMKTGEIFEGRLYAIGAGQVWLETGIGRLALSGKRVSTISPVTLEEKNGTTVEDLPRMRVRTPGGIFFGKVLSRDEYRVTLLTDDGGRLTLESRDVEAAPLGNTRVIGPVEKP